MSKRLKFTVIFVLVIVLIGLGLILKGRSRESMAKKTISKEIKLPGPIKKGTMPLEESLLKRRSKRNFKDKDLTLEQISQLLWAAQGVTDSRGYRTAPSAGALYPLEVYIVKSDGVFHYEPLDHKLITIVSEDRRDNLSLAALGQSFIAKAPLDIVIAAVYGRTKIRYGGRTDRYVHMEAGHAAQNIHLQAVALGLGSVPVGAFWDDRVSKALDLPSDHKPLYIIPVGYPK